LGHRAADRFQPWLALSADDWDAQTLFFLGKGFRVIAHDRRGHGPITSTCW
jgi:pimeloyl-ACP methyl ester carboxylesterase